MPSTYSTDLRIELIANGEKTGTWGTITNSNLGTLIEDAISGSATVLITSSAQALTIQDGAYDQARNAAITVTTTTTANFSVFVPPVTKLYTFRNNSAYVATVYASTVGGNTTPAGTGLAIPAGKSVMLRCDGVNIVDQFNHVVNTFSTTGSAAIGGSATVAGSLAVSGALTASSIDLTTPLPIVDGGTGQSTQAAAITALAGTSTLGQYLRGNGTNVLMSAIQVADVPTLNQNTTGTAANVTGTVAIANGGTGATTAATARTSLGLGTIATQDASNVSLTGGSISNSSITGGSITGITSLGVSGNGSISGTLGVTGVLTAPTAVAGTSTTQVATTAFVTGAVSTVTGTLGTMSTQNANNVAITGGTISGLASALPIASGGTGLAAVGTSGQILTSTGTAAAWQTPAVQPSIGVGQTWQAPSRALNTNYTNSTGKPIMVTCSPKAQSGTTATAVVDGITILNSTTVDCCGVPQISYFPFSFIVPNGSVYRINGSYDFRNWAELR